MNYTIKNSKICIVKATITLVGDIVLKLDVNESWTDFGSFLHKDWLKRGLGGVPDRENIPKVTNLMGSEVKGSEMIDEVVMELQVQKLSLSRIRGLPFLGKEFNSSTQFPSLPEK